MVLFTKKGLFQGQKGQMGDDKYRSGIWKDLMDTLHRILQNQYFL